MYQLTKKFNICCSHRLNNPSLSEEENKELFGRCNNLPSHGHNYTIILTLEQKDINQRTGMILNFNEIKTIFKEIIDNRYDHQFLNDDIKFKDIVSSAENMCKVFFDLLKKEIPELCKIEIYETEGASAIYMEDTK